MKPNLYRGSVNGPMEWDVYAIYPDNSVGRLDPGYKHGVNHSPDGYAWGYSGSGPAQLAFAILLAEFGVERAKDEYQDFKSKVIARMDGDKPFLLWFEGEDVKWEQEQ